MSAEAARDLQLEPVSVAVAVFKTTTVTVDLLKDNQDTLMG